MTGINELFMIRQLVLTVLLILSGCAVGVAQSIEIYKVKVVTKDGSRVRGTLDDVSETHVAIGDNDQAAPWFRRSGGKVPLSDVLKVVLRRQSKRRATIQGGIVGGLITGFAVVQSTEKNGFRSPVVYVLNLVMAAGGGAAAGAIVGHGIGSVSARTIRPFRSGTVENVSESLRRQLDPFTYSYQSDVLNRVPQ